MYYLHGLANTVGGDCLVPSVLLMPLVVLIPPPKERLLLNLLPAGVLGELGAEPVDKLPSLSVLL